MLILFMVGIVLEVLLYIPPIRKCMVYLASGLVALVSFGTAGIVMNQLSLIALSIAFISIFRVVNLLRIAQRRMHDVYLHRVTRRTGFILITLQLPLVFLYTQHFAPLLNSWLQALVTVQLTSAIIILVSTLRAIYKTRPQPNLEHFSDKELPTITIAIPARNETSDLEECIQSLVENDYPKLEIIVLDDCSQDRTPEIIKSFAHNGVRFIRGGIPEDRWLAKNLAYQRLYEEASGKYVLFCGVDVRFGPQAIRGLVTMLLTRKKDMISIMPLRGQTSAASAFIQPMRYWWELALPRRLFRRPPVLSTCWIIRRKSLKLLGGFNAVSRAIIPEAYFARELIKQDVYSFIRANKSMQILTLKSPVEQRNTAIRMRYPQVHRRPELVMAMVLAEALLLLGPFVVLVIGWGDLSLVIPTLVSSLSLIIVHLLIVGVSDRKNIPVALINFPLAVMFELVIGLLSMSRYEFSEVDWKGRNVCIPAMHVVQKLPPLAK
jgi:glycosyltransferase involved in cell wall biosynthesis